MPFIDRCPECPYQGKAIGPRGDPARRVVLVGEAPGATEIIDGRPFVGPAGGVLWKALTEVGLSEADVFITNAVACKPRPVHPWVRAIDACRGRLARDIEAHPEAIIVALGGTAVRAVTGERGWRVLDAHGAAVRSLWGQRVVPTLHPAYVLRFPGKREVLVEDLRHARRLAGY